MLSSALSSDLASALLTLITAHGWRVEVRELIPRAAKPWSDDAEMPGIELSATRIHGQPTRDVAVQVRDWSRPRAEFEAVVMLAHRLGIDLHSEVPHTEVARAA